MLDKNSALAARVVEYGGLVERYDIIVPSAKAEQIELSGRVMDYGSGGSGKLARFFKIYQTGKKLGREEKYDVITVQDQYYLALVGLLLAKKFRAGLEIQVHGFEKFQGLRKLIAEYVLPRAGAIRCVSQRLRRELVEKFGVEEERITVAPIHSELRITNYELRIKKDTNKFIFLTVGRLVSVKNIGMQIEAMREVVKSRPEAELWIAGDGMERKNLELRIKNYELGKNIKMLGWKNDLAPHYNMADAFLLTSNSEGWGMVVIGAAAAGLPIIMTDVGCAGEVIKNGESGLVIPVRDKEKLIEAMLKIMADENLRKKLSENAKLAAGRLPSKAETMALYKKSWGLAVNL